MSRRRLALLGLAALVLFALGAAIPLALGNEYGPADVPVILAKTATGGSFLAAGLVAVRLRPRSRIGLLMMAVGLAWFVGVLTWVPNALAWSIGWVPDGLWAAVLGHLYVSFPSGRLLTRRDRMVVAVIYGWALAVRLANTLTWPSHFTHPLPWTRNVFAVLANQRLNDEIMRWGSVGSAVLIVLVAATVISHWRRATPPGRRVLAPVTWTAVPMGAWVMATFFADNGLLPNGSVANLVTGWGYLMAAAMPFGFLVGLQRTRLGRGAVADLILRLGKRAEPAERLDAALAQVLGDPSARILYRVPAPSGGTMYVDAAGQPTGLPEAGGGAGRAVTIVDQGGEPMAALVCDASLLDEPELLEATLAAARLAIDNARLQAAVRAQLEEVRASRARILHAGDVERQRIERNLHDGAQQRLVALSFALRIAESRVDGNAELKAALGDAANELREAMTELRQLAQGLHPAILTRSGLSAAVRSAAIRAAVPAEVTEAPEERFPPDIEAAAYYVVSEALANAGKHALATHARVSICRSGGILHVEVADDGAGGADMANGSGLTGLADRVAVLGGTLSVTSPPGAGTTITAELPCSAQ